MNNNFLQLVMIVKNGAKLVTETLLTIKPHIDYWTILDTGSTDGTQEVIKKKLEGIPGKLYEEPFIDFSTSRNRALELAGNICKYTIMLDDTYVLHGAVLLKKYIKQNKKFSAFNIKIFNNPDVEEASFYYSIRILRAENNLRYKYKVHEIVDIPLNKVNTIHIEDIYIFDNNTMEGLNRSQKRQNIQIKLMKEDLEIYPNDPYIFYNMARSYYNLSKFKIACVYFKKSKKFASKTSNVYYSSSYFYYLINSNKRYLPWIELEQILVELTKTFPKRAEPFYQIALNKYREKDYIKSADILKKAYKINLPDDGSMDLFVDIYTINIPFLLSESLIKTEEFDLAEKIIKIETQKENSSNLYYNLILSISNLNFGKPIKFEKKSVVFNVGRIAKLWTPDNIHKKGSGSEIMAFNIAKNLTHNFRVFLFGNFKDGEESTEGIYSGVQFIDISHYTEFIKKYYIDNLIVLRNSSNLLYFESVENVYFWIHDVLPFTHSGIFQTHKTKLKKVVCVSEWQKINTQMQFDIPDEYFSIIENAIDINRFVPNPEIQREKFRFIYSSSPDRGLNYLLEIIPKIKEKYSETTLHIFANRLIIDDESIKIIENNQDYIHLHSRVSQNELAIEFMKSDVWLYPTDFEETYCITAVEAMASGVLCAGISIGSLTKVIGNKGILVNGDIRDNSVKDTLLKKLFFVLDRPEIKANYIRKGLEFARSQNINWIMEKWNDILVY